MKNDYYFCGMISKNRIKFIRGLELKKKRIQEGLFVAEGRKLVGELLEAFECIYIAANEEWIQEHHGIINKLSNNDKLEVDEVTESELSKITFLDTPQDVLAIFKMPQYEDDFENTVTNNLCLALDGVQNPGNMGTILRISDWFGIEDVYCTNGCVDVFNPKCVQATMGAIARVRVHYVDLKSLLSTMSAKVNIYGTFLDGENIYSTKLDNKGLIIMGNEGNGISPDIEHYVTNKILIPNYPEGRQTSESLNVAVATAIVCAEFRRNEF